jgi:hypothetical protein
MLATACGSSGSVATTTPDGGGSTAGFTPFACSVKETVVNIVQPDLEVDHLEQRQEVESSADAGLRSVQVLSSRGEACKTASDKAKCQERLAALRLEASCGPDGGSITGRSCRPYFVYTRGDAISSAVSSAELTALIGKIDNPEELRLIVQSAGYALTCGGSVTPEYKDLGGGAFEVHASKVENCAPKAYAVTLTVDAAGKVTETKRTETAGPVDCAIAGRRPEGFVLEGSAKSAADYIATMATLESAAVLAFRDIAHTLFVMNAPQDLQRRVREATRDEIRHTRTMRELSAEQPPTTVRRTAYVLPSRQEFACHNMAEGCVREAFGAMVAAHQAAHAQDLGVRRAMLVIAQEERAHAELSWDIAMWLDQSASAEERQRVQEAHTNALDELARDLGTVLPDHVTRDLGLPTRAQAEAMLRMFRSSLEEAQAA